MLAFVFNPDRAMRLVEYHAPPPIIPALARFSDKTLAATWKAPRDTGYNAEIQRTVNEVALYDLISLSMNDHAAGQVRAISAQKLNELKYWLSSQLGSISDESWRAHYSFALSQIRQLQEDQSS